MNTKVEIVRLPGDDRNWIKISTETHPGPFYRLLKEGTFWRNADGVVVTLLENVLTQAYLKAQFLKATPILHKSCGKCSSSRKD